MIGLGAFFIFVSLCLLVISMWPDESKRIMRERLRSEVGRRDEVKIVKFFAGMFEPIHRILPIKGYLRWAQRSLSAAGVDMPPIHYIVIQELAALGGAGAYVYSTVIDSARQFNPVWLGVATFIGLLMPYLWLRGRIRARQETVARDLPEVVDLLSLCVGAGADFISALARIVREFRACPVREELAIVLSEIKVGKSRRDSLRAFAMRVQTAESSTFARTLIQADRMGTGLVDALKVLSEDMREARYHWAERYAQKAPLKMLLPLMLSLMSALIIVAGPIILQFLRGGVMGMASSF